MPSLKDLKNRIISVKSTRKITSAMKMVAASKLRRAQEKAESARPYGERMGRMLATLASNADLSDMASPLIAGTGKNDTVLLIVVTSDRGLCGAFNASVVREARRRIRDFENDGKKVVVMCAGRKGRDLLRRDHAKKIVHSVEHIGKLIDGYTAATMIANKVAGMLDAGEFDVAHIVYNRFKSAISQIVTTRQIVPVEVAKADPSNLKAEVPGAMHAIYELFEPAQDVILGRLLPRNLAVQIYGALLESGAGEQGARMTAMDNATRNAGDMIDRLTLNYNRSRQAYITKELIEIISGAEAL